MVPRGLGRVEVAALLALVSVFVLCVAYVFTWEVAGKALGSIDIWLLLLLGAVGLPFSLWLQARIARTARLVIDGRGLAMQSGLSGLPTALRGLFRSDWELRWDEIDRVVAMEALGALHIRRKGGLMPWAVALRPLEWVEEGGQGKKAIRETALWRALADRKLLHDAGSDPRYEGITFDMWRHPATRVALVAGAAFVAYAGVDGALQREAWADSTFAYYLPHVVAGLVASAVCALGLLAAREPRRVPPVIVGVLAMLVGLSAGMASYVGLVRVNEMAAGPLEAKAHRRNAACDALVPAEAGLPTVEYSNLARDYWCSLPIDLEHQVAVRRGLFGLYQVDLTAHTEAIRRFRAAR